MSGPSEFHLDEDIPKWQQVQDNKISMKINTEICGNVRGRRPLGPRGLGWRTYAGGLAGLHMPAPSSRCRTDLNCLASRSTMRTAIWISKARTRYCEQEG